LRNCVPLAAVEVPSQPRRKVLTHGVTDEAGTLMTDRPSHTEYGNVFAVRDPDGAARCAIACYTLQKDTPGEVWINHGNLLSRSFDGTTLEIYRNDELRFSASARKDRVPLLFQARLGRLKKGDVIRVAVGPGEKSGKGGGRLGFVIEETAAETRPANPLNVFSPAITAAEPQRDADGRYRTYLAKHTAQCEAILANKPELVFIGDSITARWPAELLQERYGKHRPVNLGIGGDWVQNVFWRVQNGALQKAPIRVVVLLIGTNNLSNGFTPEEVADGIGRLITAIQERTPQSKVLLLGILPRGRSIDEAPFGERLREVNARLATMADGRGVFFLDVGAKLAEPDGSIRPEVMPDGLHVAGPGFTRWLDAMKPTLDQLLGDTKVEG
jgi:beta-glucosidase